MHVVIEFVCVCVFYRIAESHSDPLNSFEVLRRFADESVKNNKLNNVISPVVSEKK